MASVRNASVAEDLVQDTFLAGIDALDSFAQRSSERTWLIGILRHKIHDHFRRVSRMRDVAGNGNPDPEKTGADFDEHGRWTHPIQDWHLPEQSLERAQFWKVFDRCVDELPENLRTSFALREIEGLDSDALAATLHTSKNNVWVLLSRARQKLRRCIELLWFAGEGK
jgi:RNA polymerase sigma-70 factor (ECF subfamily)